MFLRSGRNASTRPQVKPVHTPAPNVQSSLGSSRLTPTPALDSASERPRRSSVTVNPIELGQKIARASLAGGARNSSGGESQLPSLGSRRLRGTLQSRPGTVRSQGLRSPVIRNTRHGSSSPGDSSDSTTTAERPLSSARSRNSFSHITGRRSGTSLSEIADRLRNENPGESLREIRKRLASLEKEKELILLTRKLKEMEAEKAVGFPDSQGSVFSESPKEALIQKQIIQELKLIVPLVRAYSGATYAVYQIFIRACKYVFCTRPVTDRKDEDKV